MLKRRGLAILAGSSLLLLGLEGLGAGKLTRAEVVGSIVGAKGNVLVDRQPVLPKEAIFAGDVISTGRASGAFVNLHGTTAILVENSELALSGPGNSPMMTLVKGAVVVRNSSSQAARVDVPGAYVLVRGDGTFPSICRIAAVNASAVVIADKGQAEIHGSGAPTIVPSGKTVRLEHGIPQAGGQQAGAVTGLIPTGQVQPGGQGVHRDLNVKDTVNWLDVVYTLPKGRVRIKLTDGSELLVGSGSQMTIKKHDAQTQQTQIELKAGSVRAIVQKITMPGGKFEATTPTAVIGVVGTTWFANANPKVTGVGSVDGDVTVSNLNPSVIGTVTLHSNQFTTVPFGLPPTPPITLGIGQLNTQTSRTEVEEGLHTGPPGVGTGTSAGGVTGAVTKASSGLGTAGAAGLGAAFGGVALGKLSSANNSTTAADNALLDAQSAINAATSAAIQAGTVSTETLTQLQNQKAQGCGCPSPDHPQ